MTYTAQYLDQVQDSIDALDMNKIEELVSFLSSLQGRLFVIGSGGGAGHASHACADFRKLCNIESYAPYDNVSELTARINDNGWDTSIADWLAVSKLNEDDALLVISVGGGTESVSHNLTVAIMYAKSSKAKIFSIIGRDGSTAEFYSDVCIKIKAPENVTPITEGLQAVIWHGIVSHPKLQKSKMKW